MRYRIVVEANLESYPEIRSYHRWWLAAYVFARLFTWRHPLGIATIQEVADLPPARVLTPTHKT